MSEFSIAPTGFYNYCEPEGQFFDKELSQAIVDVIKKHNLVDKFDCYGVYDFGCGDGSYVKYIRDNNIIAYGFDGIPGTDNIPYCFEKDLTNKNFQMAPQEYLISLEVGEHVPKEYEGQFISNINSHLKPGGLLILSWAIEKQGGRGHVNEQNNDYIKSIFTEMGYINLIDDENILRGKAKFDYFKNTIMVFKKYN